MTSPTAGEGTSSGVGVGGQGIAEDEAYYEDEYNESGNIREPDEMRRKNTVASGE